MKKYFGIFLILIGVISAILNIIVMTSITTDCDNKTIKNSNTGNLVLNGVIVMTGIILFLMGYVSSISSQSAFAFG